MKIRHRYILCLIIFNMIYLPISMFSSTAIKPINNSTNKTAITARKNIKQPNYFPDDKSFYVEDLDNYFSTYSEKEKKCLQFESLITLAFDFRDEFKHFKNNSRTDSIDYLKWEEKVIKVFDNYEKLGDIEYENGNYLLSAYLYIAAAKYKNLLAEYLPEIYSKYYKISDRFTIHRLEWKLSHAKNECYYAPYDLKFYENKSMPSIISFFHNKFFITKPSLNSKDWIGKGCSKSSKTLIYGKCSFQIYNKKHYSFELESAFIGSSEPTKSDFYNFGLDYGSLNYEKDKDFNMFTWCMFPLQMHIYNISLYINYIEGKTYYFDEQEPIITYLLPFVNPRVNFNFGHFNLYFRPEYHSTNWVKESAKKYLIFSIGANLAITNYLALGFYYINEKTPSNNKNIDRVENYEGSIHFSPIPFGWGRNSAFIKFKLGYGYNIKYYKDNTSIIDKQYCFGLSYYLLD